MREARQVAGLFSLEQAMSADPQANAEALAAPVVDAPAAKTGVSDNVDPLAGETAISLEKARELRAENKSLRDRMKALEDAERKRDEEAKKAAEAKAKEEGRLADVLKARDEELESLKASAAIAGKLEALFTALFDEESKEWPEEVKAMIPEGLDARTDAMPKLRALAAKFSTATPAAGNRLNPKPAGGADPARAREAAKAFVKSLVP